MKILAIVESLTGNTMSFVEYMKETYGDKVTVEVASPKDPTTASLISKYDKIMVGCYTWNMGKIPIKTKKFVIENRDILMEKDVLIFGSGWSVYEEFCRAVDNVGIILNEKFPKAKFELRFDSDVEVEAVETLKNFLGDV